MEYKDGAFYWVKFQRRWEVARYDSGWEGFFSTYQENDFHEKFELDQIGHEVIPTEDK